MQPWDFIADNPLKNQTASPWFWTNGSIPKQGKQIQSYIQWSRVTMKYSVLSSLIRLLPSNQTKDWMTAAIEVAGMADWMPLHAKHE